MKKLLFGLLATVFLIAILPVGATAAEKHLDASFTFADPPACRQVGHVDVRQSAAGWTVTITDQFNQIFHSESGKCEFTSGWFAGFIADSVTVPNRAVHMTPGLSRAELNVTVPMFDYTGNFDIGYNALMPVHLTWTATGRRVQHPDGTVTRAAAVGGSIATCGDSPGNPCEPGGGCADAPSCTRANVQIVATFVGAKGVLQG